MGKRLAIRGHSTHGNEVIEILEMMGGKNVRKLDGVANMYSYYLSDNIITSDRLSIAEDDEFEIFTLQDFLEKFPYKVGNKVHIYVQNDDIDGRCDIEATEITSMRWNPAIRKIAYKMKDIDREFYKDEIKCKVDDFCRDYQIEELNTVISGINLNSCNYADEVELNLGDYKIEVRDGRTYAVKKKPKYPTTYDECCDILDVTVETLSDFIFKDFHLTVAHTFSNSNEYYINLFKRFFELKLCYDAYCKIAGNKMGLDGPWEPGEEDEIFIIGYNRISGIYKSKGICTDNFILSFPTEEMRDAFYDNFKKEIEQCKELL